jgi:hypothetical protein
MVTAIKQIIPADKIKGLWFFNATTGSTILDYSGNGHTITLRDNTLAAINASTCSPGVEGLAPYLTFDATHLWDTDDHDDFTFTEPKKFTLLILANMVDVTNSTLLGKYNDVGSNDEYLLFFVAGKLYTRRYDSVNNAMYLGRYYNTNLTSDEGTPHFYCLTVGGVAADTSAKIWRDGIQIDDTTGNNGAYTAMGNKTSNLGSYIILSGPTISYQTKGKVFFVAAIEEELTSEQVINLDRLLRSYAGIAL